MLDHRLDGIEKNDNIFAVIKRQHAAAASIEVLKVLRKVEPLTNDKRYIEVDQPVLVERYDDLITTYRLQDRDINRLHHTSIGDIIYTTSHLDALRQVELWLNSYKNTRGE